MESGQSAAYSEAVASRFAENEKHVSLTGTYIMDEIHYGSVRKALAFWKTIRGLRRTEKEDDIWSILKQYSSYENVFVRTVAKLESLPIRVFQRVLWFYNIDYQSLESCLRRLTLEQMSGISETYDDLFGSNPKVPRCFTEGFYNTVQQCLPWAKVAVDTLLNEDVVYKDSRLETKGALAFNFFGWDIGFHRYPKEETDEMLSDTVAETFHSLHSVKVDEEKNFTTNKGEGGIYFFLYKTLRYNYLWRNHEKVVFDEKICPGIRYTVAAWIIFLFLSPLAFYISVFGAQHGTHWHSYLRYALGAITPGIFLAAGVKYVVFKVGEVVGKGVGWLEQHVKALHIDREYWEGLWELLLVFFVCAVLAIITCAVWTGLYLVFLGSIFSATLITTFLGLYVFHMFYYEKWIFPTSVPWIGKPVVLFVILKVLYGYHRDVLDFLVWTKQLLAAVLILLGENIPMAIIATSVISFGFVWKMASGTMNHFVESDDYSESEKTARVEKFYAVAVCCTWILVALYFVGIACFFWTMGEPLWQVGTSAAFLIILLSVFVIAIEFFMVNDLKPRGILNQRKIMIKCSRYSERKNGFYKLMSKNHWIRTLEDPLPIVEKLWKFTDRFLLPDDYRELLSIKGKGFFFLDEYRTGLSYYHGWNPAEVIRFMVEGKPFKEAMKILAEKKERKQNSRRKLVRIYDLTLGCIVRPIQKVGNWFGMMIYSAQKIWKEFNEMCPLETPTKEIK
jgi:hypothetical protein